MRSALRSAAQKAGPPLALAAAATAVGFGSFVPTDYRGLSELGEIAGAGMVIAFVASITLLPALLALLKPPAERCAMGFEGLAPVDRCFGAASDRDRGGTLPWCWRVATVAVSALRLQPVAFARRKAALSRNLSQLRREPRIGANAIESMTANLDAAKALARRLATLPQVSRATTLASLIPADQDGKLTLIHKAAAAIGPSLHPKTSNLRRTTDKSSRR